MKVRTVVAAVCSALGLNFVAGCGGGGDDRAVAPPPTLAGATGHSQKGGAVLAALPAQPASAAASSPAGDEAPLSEQVAELRRELAAIRLQLARLQQGIAAPDPERDAQAEAGLRRDADRAVTTDIQSREALFRTESLDVAWSRPAEQRLQHALNGDDTGGTYVQSIECRSRTCRVVVDDAAADAAGQDLPAALARLDEAMSNVATGPIDLGDGRRLTVLYLSR